MSLALLAAAGILLAAAAVLSPLFAIAATVQRLRSNPASHPRVLNLSITLLALLGPTIWLEGFLLSHHPKGPASLAGIIAVVLLALASLALALPSRGPGRNTVVAAFATFLIIATGLFLWTAISVHHHRGEAFVGLALPRELRL